MRALIVALFSLGIVLPDALAAQPIVGPERFVGEAILAHGGAKIDQYGAEVMILEGKLVVGGKEIDFTGDFVLQFPAKFRHTVRYEADGKKHETVAIFNGDRGWTVRDGRTEEMNRIEVLQARDLLHALRVSRLTGIPNDRDCQLTSLNPAMVDGRRALGVKVSSRGEKDVVLWIGQERKFVLKLERDLQVDDKRSLKREELFSDFREVGGIVRAFKRTTIVDGKKFSESTSSEIRLYPRIDEKVFAKPQ
jgi:hypothetical protein